MGEEARSGRQRECDGDHVGGPRQRHRRERHQHLQRHPLRGNDGGEESLHAPDQAGSLDRHTLPAFVQMNEALKSRAEEAMASQRG